MTSLPFARPPFAFVNCPRPQKIPLLARTVAAGKYTTPFLSRGKRHPKRQTIANGKQESIQPSALTGTNRNSTSRMWQSCETIPEQRKHRYNVAIFMDRNDLGLFMVA
jgi:hypothetical protein